MPDMKQLIQKWSDNARGADAHTLNVAKWLYSIALATGNCERCDPDIIPPLYLTLARAMLDQPLTVQLLLTHGTTPDAHEG